MNEKNLVEETLVQIQNLEEAINENAKEILASTMKEEISELVKESMKNEAEDDDKLEDEIEMGSEDDMDMDDMDMDDEDDMDMDDMSMSMDMDSDDETIDLTDASDEEVLKVFKAMSSEDGITVVQDDDYVHLTDDNKDAEYLIQTESEEEMDESWSEEMDEDWEMETLPRDNKDEVVYDLEMDDLDDLEDMDTSYDDMDMDSDFEEPMFASKDDAMSNLEEEIVYEVEMDEADEMDEDDYMMESKMMSKPKVGKGASTGSASKFSYKKSKGGFKETMKKGNPTMGTGKAKFEFKEEVIGMESRTPKMSKEEAKEAARTYGFGSKSGRGLRKGVTPNRNLVFKEGVEVMEELETLRAKNEEYRKALNIFRDKLNEVAVFNSNLAYATRLFTEHSTSKQEKINILRRFDSADTLKESKALYKTIKDELGTNKPQQFMTESIEKVIEKAPQSGSAINLIESKTYENPQFMRMKDIMSKIIK